MSVALLLSAFLSLTVLPLFGLPWLIRLLLSTTGTSIQSRTRSRRDLLFKRARAEEEEERGRIVVDNAKQKEDTDWERIESSTILPSSINGDKESATWEGVIGFFHPFCNAGGGGERVLWAAIRATQQRYPKALCVVYTGDHDVDKKAMLDRVSSRFNIHLHPARVTFLYLSTRRHVLASSWPRFTLLGQSFGSLIVAWDAFNLVAPDVFIDTMGYAFAVAFCKFLFPAVPTGAYVHYPTISTDMLGSLEDKTGTKGVNAGLGNGLQGRLKRSYWLIFAKLYSLAGGLIDVVMTNSSWTQGHILSLWGTSRSRQADIEVVFPPVAVEELAETIEISAKAEESRRPDLLFISQFRPEKNHQLIITSFAHYMKHIYKSSPVPTDPSPRLILAGSVRDDTDKMLVYKLRVLAREAGVADTVDFVVNADWSVLLSHLRTSSVGVNGMWNEHFGIGVVEYQAAGLISVVNDSGGPKMDIVVDVDGEKTGWHAATAEEFAKGFDQALNLSKEEKIKMRLRARKSAARFSEAEFRTKWCSNLERMVEKAVVDTMT